MGTYITLFTEYKENDKWIEDNEIRNYDGQNYALFGWLNDVRNYSSVVPMFLDRGLPSDLSSGVQEDVDYWYDGYSSSFATLKELLDIDYNQIIEDRRNHGPRFNNEDITLPAGQGEMMMLSEFLGDCWMSFLFEFSIRHRDKDDARIVFWFS